MKQKNLRAITGLQAYYKKWHIPAGCIKWAGSAQDAVLVDRRRLARIKRRATVTVTGEQK